MLPKAIMQASSKFIGKQLRDLDELSAEKRCQCTGLGTDMEKRLPGTARNFVLREDDILVLEAGPDAIEQFVGAAGLKFIGTDKDVSILSENLALVEVVVPEGAFIEGRFSTGCRTIVSTRRLIAGCVAKRRAFSRSSTQAEDCRW